MVEGDRRDVQLIVDDYRRRSMQRSGALGVDNPAARVEQPYRAAVTDEASGVSERLVGVTEDEIHIRFFEAWMLSRELSEGGTFQELCQARGRAGAQ